MAFLGGLPELDRRSWFLFLIGPLCSARETDAMLVTLVTKATLKVERARREKNLVP